MYMLDTNILVRAIRHPDDPVCSRICQEYGGNLCISSVTYAELVYGAKHSTDYEKNIQDNLTFYYGSSIITFYNLSR